MIDPNNLAATAHVTFDDEFNSLSLWDGNSGTWDTTAQFSSDTGNGYSLPSNGEQEWYINSRYAGTASIKPWSVSNGVLNLTAAPTPAGMASQINGYQYTSGQITTSKSFSQTYGYFEMRAQLPAGQGLWPAFWLLPENGGWPPELDAMEVLGNDPTRLYTTVHYNSDNESQSQGETVANMSSGYHTFGVDWEPDYITWYFDGQQVYKVATPAQMTGANASPMYMIANLAVGGGWPGNANASTPFPATMKIDYIRAYQSGAAPGGSSSGGASSGGSSSTGGSSSSTGGSSSGTSQTVGSSTSWSSQTLTAPNDNGTHLVGGNAADILIASHGADTLTGGAGADTFKFGVIPSSAGHVTDFTPGVDKIDLSALFQQVGYHGKYPGADGYLNLTSDGHGGTDVWFNPTGNASAGHNLITDLDGVSVSSINVARDINWGQSGTSSGSTGSSSGSTSGSTSGSSGGTSSSAHTIVAPNDSGTHLNGTTGNDTFVASHGADVMTGGGGADTFKFGVTPWSAGHITDFNPADDVLDLRPLFQNAGYHGTDPVADHYLSFASDGHGDTQVYFTPHDGSNGGNPYLITTLDHVSPAQITAKDWLFH